MALPSNCAAPTLRIEALQTICQEISVVVVMEIAADIDQVVQHAWGLIRRARMTDASSKKTENHGAKPTGKESAEASRPGLCDTGRRSRSSLENSKTFHLDTFTSLGSPKEVVGTIGVKDVAEIVARGTAAGRKARRGLYAAIAAPAERSVSGETNRTGSCLSCLRLPVFLPSLLHPWR